MPSCSQSCRALALERVKVHMAITAARQSRYTRQETLPALLLRYCPIFSLGWSAFVFPLKPRILELRRPSRYMEASYMEARVYLIKIFNKFFQIKFIYLFIYFIDLISFKLAIHRLRTMILFRYIYSTSTQWSGGQCQRLQIGKQLGHRFESGYRQNIFFDEIPNTTISTCFKNSFQTRKTFFCIFSMIITFRSILDHIL